jgi:GT2 family glycosyltransferase
MTIFERLDERISVASSHSGMSANKIGVVTVTYNSSGVLPDFLSSLDNQTYRDFTIYAVDSGSSDDSVSVLKSHGIPNLKVIVNYDNVGIAKGNNQGIQRALDEGCQSILLLNNDVAFGPDLLYQLLKGLEDNSCDMTVPLIYFYDHPTRIWAAGGGFQSLLCYRNYHRGEGAEDKGQYNKTVKAAFAPACCILIRREVFEAIGPMDERFFVYSDDVDFMYRALRAGLSMFVIPSAKLWHKVHTLTGGSVSDFTLFYGSRGRALFLYKHFGRITAGFWTTLYCLFCRARPLFGRDTWHRSSVRIKGTQEGRTVALAGR